jgi:hypothetical protein
MNTKQTHWFFKRIQVQAPVEIAYFQLAAGYAFLLRRFHLIQPEYIQTAGPVYTGFPRVGVELHDGTGKLRWQLQSIPAEMYSSPRTDGVIVKTETAPFDQTGYGINMSAVFKPRSNTINLFYDTGENIFIRLSGMQLLTPPGFLCPNYIDIAAEGVYIK